MNPNYDLSAYYTLEELAQRFATKAKNPVAAMYRRCKRAKVPMIPILGTRMVLKTAIAEHIKSQLRKTT